MVFAVINEKPRPATIMVATHPVGRHRVSSVSREKGREAPRVRTSHHRVHNQGSWTDDRQIMMLFDAEKQLESCVAKPACIKKWICQLK